MLASADSPVHDNFKRAVVEADETSTVLLPLGVGRIDTVRPGADIIGEMWSGCRDMLAATARHTQST